MAKMLSGTIVCGVRNVLLALGFSLSMAGMAFAQDGPTGTAYDYDTGLRCVDLSCSWLYSSRDRDCVCQKKRSNGQVTLQCKLISSPQTQCRAR